MGRLDLPDPRRDEDEEHPEDRDARLGITPEIRRRITAIRNDPNRRGWQNLGGSGGSAPRGRTMTRRRRQILLQFALGRTNEEISARLGISTETVKSHARLIFTLLEARTRAHAVAIAYEKGLLKLGTVPTGASGDSETGR